jgi:hypothetical protein
LKPTLVATAQNNISVSPKDIAHRISSPKLSTSCNVTRRFNLGGQDLAFLTTLIYKNSLIIARKKY